jgi:hypothetical protein
MAELSGSLDSVGLTAIFGLLTQLGKSGRMHVSVEPWSGEVFLKEGRIVGALFGVARGIGGAPSNALRGLAALDAILLLVPYGRFFFAEGTPSSVRNIALTAADLQAHLAAVTADRSVATTRLQSLTAVLHHVDPREQPHNDEPLVIDRQKLSLLLAIDGRRTLAELIGEQDLLRTLTDVNWLLNQGLIRMAPASVVPAADQFNGDPTEDLSSATED